MCVRVKDTVSAGKNLRVSERDEGRGKRERVREMKVEKRERVCVREREREFVCRAYNCHEFAYSLTLTHSQFWLSLEVVFDDSAPPPPTTKEKHSIQKVRPFFSSSEGFSSSIKRCYLCPLYQISE